MEPREEMKSREKQKKRSHFLGFVFAGYHHVVSYEQHLRSNLMRTGCLLTRHELVLLVLLVLLLLLLLLLVRLSAVMNVGNERRGPPRKATQASYVCW